MRIIGPGRAGRSFATAWNSVGVAVEVHPRHEPVSNAAGGVDAVLIATPDRAIAQVAQAIEPGDAAVLHCSGVTGLGPVSHHQRHGSIHPLMALPTPEIGAARLATHGWFATDGDTITAALVAALGGRSFVVRDEMRPLYHAAAAVSANHLVALLGQVERLAAQVGVPARAFFDLAQGSFDDVVQQGAAAALTGPAARGDLGTLAAHRAALPGAERGLYDVLADAAHQLANADPGDLTPVVRTKERHAGHDNDR